MATGKRRASPSISESATFDFAAWPAYYDFEDEGFEVEAGNIIDTDLDMHTVRFGVAYKF
ncbi:hypothetical protein [Notoacmeibacter ruber]|uniref:Porin family protein n=1 Tax=Notoacmeibacter ruber TaxID=2670375 RepID=A0A3L7JF81_9HYPH|nr:hypothetical protein [Notoacmeibacter ruber]RLQ88979.1 hypothetical protein D8780_12780 [Notoacmeibacter ruber]